MDRIPVPRRFSAPLRSRSLAFLAATALTAPLLALLPSPAHADVTLNEIYPVPAGGVYPIEGHGWGHGHGMSQYGSRGGATLGKTADQITAFYYPGTTKAALANVPMRIRLMADTGPDTIVRPATGLVATDLATGASLTLPAGATRWRSITDATGLHVQRLVSGAWSSVAIGGRSSMTGPIQFAGPTFIRVDFPDGTSRDYRGAIRSVRLSATAVSTVAVMPMESYLRGVVPRESPASWEMEALKAQAIAARSYSEYKRAHIPAGQYFDICDTTQCQVFGGSTYYSAAGARLYGEEARTNQAVQETSGVIRAYQGAAIFAEFSSSNGGWSTTGSMPYLAAQRDDWDGVVSNNVHYWTAQVSADQIEARYPAVGTLLRMRVTSRDGNGDWKGRVKTVVLEGRDSAGNATSVSTTGAGIYNANVWPASSNGLKSSWWHPLPATNAAIDSQSPSPRLVQSPGTSRATITVTMRNNGTTTWPTSNLRMVVASPVGEADPLVGGSAYPGVYTGSATSIPPDGLATFAFNLTGDNVKPGVYARAYRIRLGNGTVFGATVGWRIAVDAPRLSGVLTGPTSSAPAPTGDAPGVVQADGRTVTVPVNGSTTLGFALKNTGNVTWPVTAGGPVRLGTDGPRNRVSPSSGSTWVQDGTRASSLTASAPVAPNQTGQLGLVLNGNGRPLGATTEAFAPLYEGKAWLAAGKSLVVVRVDPSTPRAATVEARPASVVNLTTAPTGTATLVIRLRNVGNAAWSVGSERLSATSGALSTSAWPSSTEAPKLAANVSRPSITSVYPGEVGEWRVPISASGKAAGSYPLSFRAMDPSGTPYGPTVATTAKVITGTVVGSLVRVSGVVRIARNGTGYTFFDVKNTGTANWPVRGALRAFSFTSGGSPSRNSTWLSNTRPSDIRVNVSRIGAPEIRPGEVGRFGLTLAGNGRAPGTYAEDFGGIWDAYARLSGVRATLRYTLY
jgi:SpoIID/LytB domain protein